MRIAVLANLKRNAPVCEGPSDLWSELDDTKTVAAIVQALERRGHEARFFEGSLALVGLLPEYAPELCFNLCEGHRGDSRESQVPAVLELLGLPYTGAGVLGLALSLDKTVTKRLLRSEGLATPEFQVFSRPDEPLSQSLRFPLFVKPSGEGSGKGVTAESVVRDEVALRAQVRWVLEQYQQPCLVERFVEGREITVGLLGNLHGATVLPPGPAWTRLQQSEGLLVLPPYELLHEALAPKAGAAAYTNETKTRWEGSWVQGQHYHCPAPLTPALSAEVCALAAATFRLTECRDFARVDLRLDCHDHNRPYVLEVNALPGLAPGHSDLVYEAQAAGIAYDDLVHGILEQALARLRASRT